jgi:hypothetical protein
MMADLVGSSPSTLTSRGKAPAEATATAAVQFDSLADYVGLNAKAVEFDLMLPIVAGGHRLGALWMAGLDEREEHVTLKLWAQEA